MKTLTKFGAGIVLALVTTLHFSLAQDQDDKSSKEAQIRVPGTLTKVSGIEVWFPTPIVADGEIGKELAGENILEFTPPLKGTFKWNSRYGGTFSPSEVPTIGTKYEVTLAGGIKDAAGKEVKPVGPVVVPVAPFQSTQHTPSYFDSSHFVTRQPQIAVAYNDDVDVTSVASRAAFVNKNKVTVPVTVANAVGLQAEGLTVANWQDGFLVKPARQLNRDGVALNIVVIRPSKPLPPGENWKLVIGAGVENAAKSAKTLVPFAKEFGTISEMSVNGIEPESPLNEPRQLNVSFSKSLPEKYLPSEIAKFITVSPAPANAIWEVYGSLASMKADFEIGIEYRIEIKAGVPCIDGTKLEKGVVQLKQFKPHEAGLGIAATDEAQWIGGKKQFSCDVANLKTVNVKIKRVDPQNIVYAMRGYQTYSHDESKGEDAGGFTRIPYSAVAGKTVWDHDFVSGAELDKTETFNFKWNEVLKGDIPGVYFVSMEGIPKDELQDQRRVGTQALIQLTDIGLAWKFNQQEALVFAFSHTTGLPLKDVQLMSFDDDNNPVETQSTDANGMVALKLKDTRWLVAAHGMDWHGVEFHPDMPKVNLWQFDLSYNRMDEKSWRDTLIFTDRPVYQPGETVFLKCITRAHSGDGLSIHANKKARLKAYDLQNRLFLEKEVQFSETGTFAESIALPANGVGSYHFQISFLKPLVPTEKPAPVAAANGEGEEEDFEEEGESSDPTVESSAEHYVLVQEYRPNAFKIKFDDKGVTMDGEKVGVPISAAYFMGKVLSEATVKWSSTLYQNTFSAEKFPNYNFDATRVTSIYDGESYHYFGDNDWVRSQVTAQGEEPLSDKGAAVLPALVPSTFGIPGPKSLVVAAEITDINQQTIADSYSRIVHSSEFYIGIQQVDRTARIGQEVPINAAAVANTGERWAQPVKAKLLIERLTWNSVKVEIAGGGTETRNEVGRVTELEQDVELNPAPGKEQVSLLKPTQPGTYVIALSTSDAKGAPVRCMSAIYVYGAAGATFAQEDGIKITLEADKEAYVAGEVAKIAVKSPFKGKALVTVERQKVFTSQLIDLDGASGAVEIPITEAYAPNCFVSVTHLRGGADDPREHKQPDYKMGYLELKVNSDKDLLKVEIKPAKPEFRPAEQVEVLATVKDSAGKPVAGAEVALWAVDEGILSLTPYNIPDPYETFHYQLPLDVQTGISLNNLLTENPEALDFANKGFIIGGGDGDGGQDAKAMRKDFKPCAYWNAALITGADGTVKAKFVAPDGLTQYRVVAVVNEGTSRFGNAESSFKINKPLMVEPAMPVFANVGDEMVVKAVVHNTTEFAGKVSLELELDNTAEFFDSTKGESVKDKKSSKTLTMSAGQTTAAYFNVRFVAGGSAVWKWSGKGIDAPADLADAVQSTIAVGYAEPMLRDIRFVTLTDNGADNLLKGMRPELLDGAGKVEIQVSNSILIEGTDAIGQVLHYPYGCVEQTTSSMLPWLALKDLKKVLPSIDRPDAEMAKAIQKGADRLLSMQTHDGGLAYWPGGAEPNSWGSAHGGMGLVMARNAGAVVPQARLDSLTKYLSKNLREDITDASHGEWTDRCMACYTLALAGKPEPAYHETLFQKRADLSADARAMLALAIVASAGPQDMAKTLLSEKASAKNDWWLGDESTEAMRSVAWSRLKDAKQADATMAKLIQQRAPRGDWRNTFNNAWVLMALAEYESGTQPWDESAPAAFAFEGQKQEAKFGAQPTTKTLTFNTKGGGKLPTLSAKLPAGRKLYVRMEISARAKAGQMEERSQGFAISRSYQKIGNDGNIINGNEYLVGDLVLVTINMDLPEEAEYLVVDDPLPANLEGVNPAFQTMAANPLALGGIWMGDYQEMRRDRVLFFKDYYTGKGRSTAQYLARVVAAGNAAIPQAKIEMMYDPAKFGLSKGGRFISKAAREGEMAGE